MPGGCVGECCVEKKGGLGVEQVDDSTGQHGQV